MPTFLRLWAGSGFKATCRKCKGTIRWWFDDHGKQRPIDYAATPIREDRDPLGRRFQVFDGFALHRCQVKAQKRLPVTGSSHVTSGRR